MINKKAFDCATLNELKQNKCEIRIGSESYLDKLNIDKSKLDLLIQLPPINILQANEILPGITKVSQDGLTSIVYQYVDNNHGKYAIKIKRANSAVLSEDLQLSFDNEIFQRKKLSSKNFASCNQTVYAIRSKGVIISNWINGEYIKNIESVNGNLISLALNAILELEMQGYFNYDLNLTNIIYTPNGLPHFFDFGALHTFNPKTSCNPYGADDTFFDPLERYRDSHIMRYLTRLERNNHYNCALDIYQAFTPRFAEAHMKRANFLTEVKAEPWLITRAKKTSNWYANCDAKCLLVYYALDKYYSYVSTLEENLYQHFFDFRYFERVKELLNLLNTHYDVLQNSGKLINDDSSLSKVELCQKYENRYMCTNT